MAGKKGCSRLRDPASWLPLTEEASSRNLVLILSWSSVVGVLGLDSEQVIVLVSGNLKVVK